MTRLTYIAGAVAGLILGGVIGFLKNVFIWQRYLQKNAAADFDPSGAGSLYARAFISYTVNILALVLAFFTRNLFPFDGIAFLVGTAAALAVMNKVMAIRQKKYATDGKGDWQQ